VVKKKSVEGIVRAMDGVERQSLCYGEKTHLVKFFLERGKIVPLHSHMEEQTGYLIKGKMLFTIDGKEYLLETGDSWSIPGGVEHGVKMIEDCEVVEVFSPVRKEYLT